MTDKQPSKADQVAALRLARVEAKSSDGRTDEALAGQDGDSRGSPERAARTTKPSSIRVGSERSSPSGANSGAPQPRGEPARTNPVKIAGSPNIKRGRPRIGETRDRPWEALGMSMRTWYRRQAEKREGSK